MLQDSRGSTVPHNYATGAPTSRGLCTGTSRVSSYKPPPLQGFLRFNLEEEKFDFISHAVLLSDEQPLQFIKLGGKHRLYKQYGRRQMFSELDQNV